MDRDSFKKHHKLKLSALTLAMSATLVPMSEGIAWASEAIEPSLIEATSNHKSDSLLQEQSGQAEANFLVDSSQSVLETAQGDKDVAKTQDETSESESLTKQTQEVVSDLISSVWSDDEKNTSNLDASREYSSTVDPFAKQQSSWIEEVLGQTISDAQAAKDKGFNFFLAHDATNLKQVSSGIALSEHAARYLPKLKDESLSQDTDYKQDYLTAIDRGFSYVSYLFHQNNPYRSRYQVPIVFLNEQGSQSLWEQRRTFSPFAITPDADQVRGNYPLIVSERRYDNQECLGLGIIEADLLGKCFYSERNDLNLGAVFIPAPPESIAYEGVYNDIIRHITPNVMQLNGLTTGVEIASRLAGINAQLSLDKIKVTKQVQEPTKGKKSKAKTTSSLELTASFADNLGSFEQHLYSTKLKDFIKPSQSLHEIDDKCLMSSQKDCGLYFVGEDVLRLLGNHAGTNFILGQSVLLPQLKVQSVSDYFKSQQASDGTSFYVPLDRYGSGRYTISSMDLAQIKQARLKSKQAQDIPSQDAAAINDLYANPNSIAVTVESASIEMRNLVAESMNAATKTFGGKLPAEYIDELRNLASESSPINNDTSTSQDAVIVSATKDAQVPDVASALETNQNQDVQDVNESKLTQGAGADTSSQDATDKPEDEPSLSANIATALAEGSGANANKEDNVYKFDPPLSAQVGIPVYFNEFGQPSLGLRNTILSFSDYKNYNFLTEAEMMVLSDLGYSIESAEFYGTSIYTQGQVDQRYVHNASNSFGLYDHRTKSYDPKQPSVMPSAVGLHIYGDYNDIVQSSVYNLGGVGSIGVRIDGCDNYLYQSSDAVIETSGLESSGIAFTYGKNNSAFIGGKVVASGSKGVAIRADMGSNINSDLVEYRGSYVRARSLDYIEGRMSLQEASAIPLLDELNGPQVQHLTIAGQISGNRAAIYIDESSLVRNINVSSTAQISGGIYSIWNPNVDGAGNIKVRHDSRRSELLDAIIQYPVQDQSETTREMAVRELTTCLNLGVLLDARNKVIVSDTTDKADHDQLLVGDPKSRTVIDGSVSGGAIKVRQYGGKNVIRGDVRAYEIELYDGVLKLIAQESAIHQLNRLTLNPYTVLDLVDGKGSSTYVQEEAYFGRNSTVRVDVDSEGNILDLLIHMGQMQADDYQIRIEPAVSYETLKSLASNPKTMLNFVTNFMQKTSEHLNNSKVSLRFPRYIWDAAGSYGREIKCGAKGCRLGGFVSNEVVTKFDNIQPWRYYLAFSGLGLFILGFYVVYFFRRFKQRRA